MKTLLAFGALMALVGCHGTDRLGDLDHRVLHVYTNPGSSEQAQLEVYVGGSTAEEHGCPELGGDLAGTVNGTPLAAVMHGGGQLIDGRYWRCDVIELVGPIPGPGPTTIRVWDSSSTIEATFPALFDERRLTLVTPPDGTVYIGDPVQLSYSPATDEFADAYPPGTVTLDTRWAQEPAARQGGTFTYYAREIASAGEDGPGFISLQGTVVVHGAPCLGAEDCEARPDRKANWVTANFVDHERGNDDACFQCGCACDGGKGGTLQRDEFVGGPPAPVRCSDIACLEVCPNGHPTSACLASTPEEVRR
jgi:hypothetical protein